MEFLDLLITEANNFVEAEEGYIPPNHTPDQYYMRYVTSPLLTSEDITDDEVQSYHGAKDKDFIAQEKSEDLVQDMHIKLKALVREFNIKHFEIDDYKAHVIQEYGYFVVYVDKKKYDSNGYEVGIVEFDNKDKILIDGELFSKIVKIYGDSVKFIQ